MQARSFITVLAGLSACAAPLAQALQPASPMSFEQLAAQCAPEIHPATLKAVVRTESSGNPYAIGVVGGELERQPRSLAEAIVTARELERQGFNFSMGLGQVNRHNLAKHGETYDTVFEPCRNLKAGGAILKDCYLRAKRTIGEEQNALRAAFSCYYSGNFTRGLRPDKVGQPSYVQKVTANASGEVAPIHIVPAIQPKSADGTSAGGSETRSAPPAKQIKAPSAWVTLADSPKEIPPRKAQADDEAEIAPTVKVRLTVPAGKSTSTDPIEKTSVQSKGSTRPADPVEPEGDQQEPAFVLFVN